jgi:hypothetical protein
MYSMMHIYIYPDRSVYIYHNHDIMIHYTIILGNINTNYSIIIILLVLTPSSSLRIYIIAIYK